MAKEKKTKQKVQELWEKSNENAGPRTVVVLGVVAIAAAIVFIVILSGAVLHS